MEEKQYCSTCKWYAEYEGVCCNRESEFRADFRNDEYSDGYDAGWNACIDAIGGGNGAEAK